LFRLETDGARWSQWAKPLIVQSSWEQQGESEPAGVGAVRRVGMWPFLMREKTVAYEMLIFLRGVVQFLARRLVTAAERN
jgi:hypothetical protein